MLDLGQLSDTFELVHPKAEVDKAYEDVKFYVTPMPSEVSFRIYEGAKKKNGKTDAKFISDTFVRVLKDWKGIVRNGAELECNEANKREFINHPATSKLAQWIMDKTDEIARDQHNISEGN